jgi:hypothetical protein
MNKLNHIIGGTIILIDIIIITKICFIVINGNDKAVLFFIFFYPILLVANLIIGLIVRVWNKIIGKYLTTSAGAMAIIGLPLLIVISFIE